MQLYDKINIVLLGKYNVKSVGEITNVEPEFFLINIFFQKILI